MKPFDCFIIKLSYFTEKPSKKVTDLFDTVSKAKSVEVVDGVLLVDGVALSSEEKAEEPAAETEAE